MVAVDVQIATALDVEVDQSVTGNLVQHVVQKADAAVQAGLAAAVQVERDRNVGFGSGTRYLGDAGNYGHGFDGSDSALAACPRADTPKTGRLPARSRMRADKGAL